MYDLDVMITQAINGASGHVAAVDWVMIGLSSIGVPLMIAAVAVTWWSRLYRLHARFVAISAGLAFLLGEGANQIVLLFIHRVRPYETGISHLLIQPSPDFSFPSDHATAVFAIATALLVHGSRRLGLFCLVAAVFIGLSRVYVGIHFFSDILGGALTGVLAALAVQLAYREDTRLDGLLKRIF